MEGKLDAWDDVFTVFQRKFYNHKNEASTNNVVNVALPEQGNNFKKLNKIMSFCCCLFTYTF